MNTIHQRQGKVNYQIHIEKQKTQNIENNFVTIKEGMGKSQSLIQAILQSK